jgi:hypothetical protein
MKANVFFNTKDPYIKINLIFAGIIALIFIYSGIFSYEKANHPIPSNIKTITGKETTSTGLSRSFSAILRFQFDKAKSYNQNSIRVFLFFFLEFIIRVGLIPLSQLKISRKLLIIGDITVTAIIFIIAFSPFIKNFINYLPG